MVIADRSVPTDIVDRLLWQDAQQMLGGPRRGGSRRDVCLVWMPLALLAAAARRTRRGGRAPSVARGGDVAARPEQHPGDARLRGRARQPPAAPEPGLLRLTTPSNFRRRRPLDLPRQATATQPGDVFQR